MDIRNLDIILEFISKEENKSQIFTAYSINKALFPKLNEDQVDLFISKINDFKIKVCSIEIGSGSTVIYCNGLTKEFLDNGGFEAEYNIEFAKEIRRKEIEDVDFEKSKIDLELSKNTLKEFPRTKWYARISFFIAIVLALKELYIWLKPLLFQ